MHSQYTPPQNKRNAHFFLGTPGLVTLTQGHVNLAQNSLTYTCPQKKCNLRKVSFGEECSIICTGHV